MTITTKQHWATWMIGSGAIFLIAGYEFARSSANTLFKAAYGSENMIYGMAAVPFAIIFMLYLYSRLLSWKGPRVTLWITSFGSAALIAACFAGINLGWRPASAIILILKEAYIMMLVEQYWSFINSNLTVEVEKRMSGFICAFGALGGVIGGLLVGVLAVRLGTINMLPIAAVMTLIGSAIADIAFQKCGNPIPADVHKRKRGEHFGFKAFADHPLLIWLFAAVVLSQAVSVSVELSFQTILQTAMPDADLQTAFSGKFYAMLEGVALLMQLAATPIIFRFLPLTVVMISIPIINLIAGCSLYFQPTLFIAGLALTIFKGMDYSIFRSSKELSYVPLSFDARYRAKEVIDVFGYRFGKGGTTIIMTLIQRFSFVAHNIYSLAAVIAALAWAIVAIPLTAKIREQSDGSR